MQVQTTEKIALSVAEAAALLGVSKPTMYDMTHIKGFPAIRFGKRRTLISRARLIEWFEKQCMDGINE